MNNLVPGNIVMTFFSNFKYKDLALSICVYFGVHFLLISGLNF